MLFSKQDLASTQPDLPPQDEALSAMCHWTRLIVHAWATTVYAFTRRSFGVKFFTPWGISGLLVLSGWSALTVPPQESGPLSATCVAYFSMCVWHRIQAPISLNGEPVHSRYIGWPRVCDVLPVSESVAKAAVEPCLVGLAGFGLAEFNPSLGLFFVIGSIACLLDWLYLSRRDYRRARQIRDAEIEQERTMDTYDQYFNQP